MAAKSRTAIFYKTHPQSRKKHVAYQSTFNKKPAQVKKRVELNTYNLKHHAKIGDGLDAAHKGKKIVGYKRQSANRGDTNDAAGDKRSRNARYRPGGRKK